MKNPGGVCIFMIHLMIADSHCMMREGLKKLFESSGDIRVVSESGDGLECLDVLYEAEPDMLILNINMKKAGFDVLRKIDPDIKKSTKILLLNGDSSISCFIKALDFGIDGYVLKSSSFAELKKAVFSIRDGGTYIQPELKQVIEKEKLSDKSSLDDDFHRVENLTERELDVLKHVSLGMYNKEIALKLGISERTIKNHLSNIFKKIGVSDRTQAAVFAIRNGIVDV